MTAHIGKLAMTLGALLVSGQLFAHSHGHPMSDAERRAADGVFEDREVKDRNLSDWDGTWQSVYPFLLDGTLDPVFRQKADKAKNRSFDDVKAYYRRGYATDVEAIGIENNVMAFHRGREVSHCQYAYNGYKILTYASGKKGVRYLFECQDAGSKAPKFVQFSDHAIAPKAASHFHLFMGNTSHEALLREMDNWPTYYPNEMANAQVVDEMLHH